MSLSARRSAGVIAVAAAAGLVVWAVVRLLGVELTVSKDPDPNRVGPVEVLVATVLAGLAAWGVHRLLARSAKTAGWWPFVGSTALAISMLGPSYLADGAAAVALIAMHLVVGGVLIRGFASPIAPTVLASILTSSRPAGDGRARAPAHSPRNRRCS